MEEEGTLNPDYFVVYNLMFCEHPLALLELRWLTFVYMVSLYFFRANKSDLATNRCCVTQNMLIITDYFTKRLPRALWSVTVVSRPT
jgi:hypothetical protein